MAKARERAFWVHGVEGGGDRKRMPRECLNVEPDPESSPTRTLRINERPEIREATIQKDGKDEIFINQRPKES